MDPQIRYCATGDGVSLAYYMIGEGPGLVMMPNLPMSHLQLEWVSLPLHLGIHAGDVIHEQNNVPLAPASQLGSGIVRAVGEDQRQGASTRRRTT